MKKGEDMLWEICRDGNKHYLFGTMHTATDEAYTYVSLAKQYIVKCTLYAAEMDLGHPEFDNISQYFKLPDGITFSSYFSQKKYDKARKILLKSFGIDIIHYENYTPFFINSVLSEKSLKQTRDMALDYHLWQFATENVNNLTGLETLSDQVNIMKQIPEDLQVKSFLATTKNISAFRSRVNTLNKMYYKGDVDGLYKLSKRSLGQIRHLMIFDRNTKMVARMDTLMADNTCFFALGAAHISGDKGVISLLKRKGFHIKKVR